jgi:hypothetical protein
MHKLQDDKIISTNTLYPKYDIIDMIEYSYNLIILTTDNRILFLDTNKDDCPMLNSINLKNKPFARKLFVTTNGLWTLNQDGTLSKHNSHNEHYDTSLLKQQNVYNVIVIWHKHILLTYSDGTYKCYSTSCVVKDIIADHYTDKNTMITAIYHRARNANNDISILTDDGELKQFVTNEQKKKYKLIQSFNNVTAIDPIHNIAICDNNIIHVIFSKSCIPVKQFNNVEFSTHGVIMNIFGKYKINVIYHPDGDYDVISEIGDIVYVMYEDGKIIRFEKHENKYVVCDTLLTHSWYRTILL